MNMGQLPVTCGLYFSLGHSTIVIVVVSCFYLFIIRHIIDEMSLLGTTYTTASFVGGTLWTLERRYCDKYKCVRQDRWYRECRRHCR